MQEHAPLISLSIKRSSDGTKTTGDLNSLSLGFGLFQVWLYMAIFGASKLFTVSTLIPSFPYLPEELGAVVLYAFLIANSVALIALGLTNQVFLRFFVAKRALIAATAVCSLGTLLLFTTCIQGIGFAMAIISGIVMGLGSSLLLVLWGTAFSRYQFATIILNTAVASVLGVAVSFICTNWVPSPISSLVTVLLPVAAAAVLRTLMPAPYYARAEEPIFHPLKADSASFIVRFGFPVLIIGITLGVLRVVCVGEILPSGSITIQLLLGAACAVSIVIYIIVIALTKRDMFWDTLFRCIVPITMLGIACIALLPGNLVLLGGFCTSTGFICLDILMWVFFAGVSQEFRISPIFVFGLGRGLLELGSALGSALTPSTMNAAIPEMGAEAALGDAFWLPYFALAIIVTLSVGYAFLPRYRELRAMVAKDMAGYAAADELAEGTEGIDEATVKDASEIRSGRTLGASKAAEPEGSGAARANGTVSVAQTVQTGQSRLQMEADEEAQPASPEDEQADQKGKGSFYRRCEEISAQYVLSRREQEVFFLLAKGHNAAFIQDKLCVSKSTAKTHINHIYKKLDIHTQQELLNMVEDRQRGPQAEGAQAEEEKHDHLSRGGYLGGIIPVDEKEALVQSAGLDASPAASRKRPVRRNIFS